MQISDDDLAGPDWEVIPPPDWPDYPVHALSGPLGELVRSTPLPAALVAGGGLAALAALCGPAVLVIYGDDEVSPILWMPLIGPVSGGKSPARDYAFRKVRQLEGDAYISYKNKLKLWKLLADGTEKPADPTRLVGDITIEKLGGMLEDQPYRALVSDELGSMINGIGEYKPHGKDRDKWLELWSGASWRYSRVRADADYYVPRPVVSVCGTLQTDRISLLGGDQDGFRPRWFPHAVNEETGEWEAKNFEPRQWNAVVQQLYDNTTERRWELTGDALQLWRQAAKRWKAEARTGVNEMVTAALHKADQQCARCALVLAESLSPGRGGELPMAAMKMAVAITDYVMNVWRAMDSGESLNPTYTGKQLWPAVQAWRNFAASHDGKVSKRQLQQGRVGGARKADVFQMVLDEYENTFPGCVEKEPTASGGREHVWVMTPEYKQEKAQGKPRKPRRRVIDVDTQERQTGDVDTRKPQEKPGKRKVRRRQHTEPSTSGLRLAAQVSTPSRYFPPGPNLREWTANNV